MSKFCVLKGTKISLRDGKTINIENLKIGNEIIIFDIENMINTENEKILQDIKLNSFNGLIKTSRVKNIWTNKRNHYFIINDKLKITGDHIILVQRNKNYYWSKVEKLQLNDFLFTEKNIFEKVVSINEKNEETIVYNIQVHTYYNYFANSYLIHNGAPCTSCNACGEQTIPTTDFEFVNINGGSGKYSRSTFNYTDDTCTLTTPNTYSYECNLIQKISGGGLSTTDSAMIWLKIVQRNYHYYLGLLNDSSISSYSGGLPNWSTLHNSSDRLRTRHAEYNDRICFHSGGYITHAGHPDSSASDPTNYQTNSSNWSGIFKGGGTGSTTNQTTGQANTNDQKNGGTTNGITKLGDYSNTAVSAQGWGNILDKTSGSGDGAVTQVLSYNRVNNISGGNWYSRYSNVINAGHFLGMEIKYYETVITGVSFPSNQTYVELSTSDPNAYPNIKDGMEITGTGIPSKTFVDRVFRNYDTTTVLVSLIKQTGGSAANSGGHYDTRSLISQSNASAALTSSTQSNTTITIKGQRLRFLVKNGANGALKTMGPAEGITLPKYWAPSNTSSLSSSNEIKGWSPFIGDTQGANTNQITIRLQDPVTTGTITGLETAHIGGGAWPYGNNTSDLTSWTWPEGGSTNHNNEDGCNRTWYWSLGNSITSNVIRGTTNAQQNGDGNHLASGETWQTGTGSGAQVYIQTELWETTHNHSDPWGFVDCCKVTIRTYMGVYKSIYNGGSGYKVGDIIAVNGLIKINGGANCPNCYDEDGDGPNTDCESGHPNGKAIREDTAGGIYYKRLLLRVKSVS